MARKFFLSLLFGIIVLSVLALVGDAPRVADALRHFPPEYLPAILMLTLWNYALRFVKWHMYLRAFAPTKVFLRDTATGIEVADLTRPLTIRHLLTHTAGLPYASAPWLQAHRF
jgi:hypothetical protein